MHIQCGVRLWREGGLTDWNSTENLIKRLLLEVNTKQANLE